MAAGRQRSDMTEVGRQRSDLSESQTSCFAFGGMPPAAVASRASSISSSAKIVPMRRQSSIWCTDSGNLMTERIKLNRMQTTERLQQQQKKKNRPSLGQLVARAGRICRDLGGAIAESARQSVPEIRLTGSSQRAKEREDGFEANASVVPVRLSSASSQSSVCDMDAASDPSPTTIVPVRPGQSRTAWSARDSQPSAGVRFGSTDSQGHGGDRPGWPASADQKSRSTTGDVMQHMKVNTTQAADKTKTDKISVLGKIVMSAHFDAFFAAAIVCNAVVIGCQTDEMARASAERSPVLYTQIDAFFMALFIVELLLRLIAFGRRFFALSGYLWGGFDILVVVLQLAEEVLEAVARGSGENMPGLNIVRVLRLMRVVRIVRIIRFLSELRTLVVSILNSMRSLFWTIVLLILGIYLVAVYFTQLILDLRVSQAVGSESELAEYFDSLPRSMLTLYSVMSGGIDWDPICVALFAQTHPLQGLIFMSYIAFTVLALTNVVTGVFVEGALKSAKMEEEAVVLETLTRMFESCDSQNEGQISTEEFQARLQSDEMTRYLLSIDVDPGEAHMLCSLMDNNQNGVIDYEEFVGGCLRIRGTAKAIDTIVLLHEVNEVRRDLGQFFSWTEEALAAVNTAVARQSSGGDQLQKQPMQVPIQEGDDES